MDIVIYGYSDNLDKNYVSPPLSLYPLCTVSMDIFSRALSAPYFWERAPAPHS